MKVEDVTPLAKKSTWMWCSWQKMNKHFVTFVPSACTQLSVNARFSFPSRSHGTDTCESCSFITWRSCSHAVMHLESVYHQLLQFFKDKQSILISSTQLFFFFFFLNQLLGTCPFCFTSVSRYAASFCFLVIPSAVSQLHVSYTLLFCSVTAFRLSYYFFLQSPFW